VQQEPVNPHHRTGRAGRWAGHREQRRAELVESAIEAIREHGAGVSVAGIAAAAGVTKPVLYRHFTDRADLQRAVSERAAKMLLDRLLPELESRRDPIERIRAIVDAFLAAVEDEPELWRFVVHNPGGEQEAGADVVAHNLALIAGMIAAGLMEELRTRRRDAGGAEAWAYGIAGMVYTAGDWWLQRRTMTRATLTDYLTELIWGGLSGVLGLADKADNSDKADARAAATDADPAPTADADRPLRLVAGDEEG
jgi:AcrR family transcriptional regulator